MQRAAVTVCFALTLFASVAAAGSDSDLSDLEVLNRIRAEGFHRSHAMEYLSHMTEDIGARVTGSAAMREANDWARQTFEDMGLENSHLESYDFGTGWSYDHCSVTELEPVARLLTAYPRAWTPGTDGPVDGEAMRMKVEEVDDLEQYRGKIKGKIVFMDDLVEIDRDEEPEFSRYSDEELEDMEAFRLPRSGPSPWRQRYRKRLALREKLSAFLVEEGVTAAVYASSRSHGIVNVSRGGSPDPDVPHGVCAVQMAAEDYNAVLRALDADKTVRLRLDVGAHFENEDQGLAFNTIAELPGRRSKEIVMAGGHLDSWQAGTGATDNAFGSAAVMEAVRILHELDLPMRRTIRAALWSGEEEGLLGSAAYVEQHFATRPAVTDSAQLALPRYMREKTWPLQLLPEHGQLQAYFNLDNGAGTIRGIYAQENVAAAPIFREWLEPVADLGASTVTNSDTRGTDHLSFDAVGLPGFEFIQDEHDYMQRTHHTQLDVIDYVDEKDLERSSVIMAWFLYKAATMEESFPREELPTRPPERKPSKPSRGNRPY